MSAFTVWLRSEMPPTDEGKQRWTQIVEWLNTRPVSVVTVGWAARTRAVRPAGAPAEAPVTPEAEAAAVAAFLASTGMGA